jgi:sugar phosphate isomerase/epimerase
MGRTGWLTHREKASPTAVAAPRPVQNFSPEGETSVRLGLVTYNLARDWDIPQIIERCQATGFEGVELRTSHAHGVEPPLSAEQRREVRRRFQDSPVRLVGLGTTCEYHALDPAVVRQNIDLTKEFVKLAHDVGAEGVKVRPNGHQEAAGVPREKTLEQIGHALRECAAFAQDYGVQIRLEMHGSVADARDIRRIIDAAAHPNVFVCWNSNKIDVKNGSVAHDFELMRPFIGLVHINELWQDAYGEYPYRELFTLLRQAGYQGFCCAEIPASPDPERLMRYYRALFLALSA